jgi:hypothetical protein
MSRSTNRGHWGRWLSLMIVVMISAGCSKKGMKVVRSDGGTQDLAFPADDVSTGTLDLTATDSLPQSDVSQVERDAVSGEDGRIEDTSMEANVTEPGRDGAMDVATDAPGEHVSATDGSLPSEVMPETPSSLDAPVAVDLPPESGTDASRIPWDITLFQNKEFGPADDECIEGTALWLDRVAKFLAEDQMCWSNEDCTTATFTDACGKICVFALNNDRMGEFVEKVKAFGTVQCASCPQPETYPTCPPARDVHCNAGRCEYR